MTQEPERTDEEWREGLTLPLHVGAWAVTAWWPPGARGGPRELHIVPANDADPQAVARGISTATLNAIPLVEVTAAYAETIRPAAETLVDWLDAVQAEADKKRNRSPEFYALIAAEYVALVEAGERQPVQAIVKQTGKTGEAVRGWLRTARTMGLLTGEAGRTTGELTEKAKRLLSHMESSDEEGD